MIHSLGELPAESSRGYYVYLLDYGWEEPFGDAMIRNFDRMADQASRNDAVVMRGVVGAHFADEVLSWHHVNGEPSDDLLPAILITTRNPHDFAPGGLGDEASKPSDDNLLLIPLRGQCKTPNDVAPLLDRIFRDIREKKQLSGFDVAREMQRGKNGAVTDALILQPNIYGMGIDLKRLTSFFSRGRRNTR